MSSNRTSARKLQILSESGFQEPQQLDLLSLFSEHPLPELAVKSKPVRATVSKNTPLKNISYHSHGNVDVNKNFSTLCIGKPNQFAVESIKRFIASEKADFGLIYLRAPSGLGKTHILHAVGNELIRNKKTFYFSSPLLMSPLVDTFNMLNLYDAILIDDIEEIEGNTELQKNFSQLLDFALSGNVRLIITGNKLPKDLIDCEERVKGKLSSALIHYIEALSSDLAFSIVESKSAFLGLELPDGVKRLVSNQLTFNVYGLEGLLHKFKNMVEINGEKITMEVALDEIKEKYTLYRSDDIQRPLNLIAENFSISYQELMSSVRKQEFALARHVAMYLFRQKRNLSIIKIAEIFERDHSSVIYALARVKRIVESDIEMRHKINQLLENI